MNADDHAVPGALTPKTETADVLQATAGEQPRCACGTEHPEVDEEGYCQGCGKRLQRSASDHREQTVSDDFAAVSDRGLVRGRNEDNFALVRGQRGFGLIVCDGVSTTRTPEVASALVAEVMGHTFEDFLTARSDYKGEDVMLQAFATATQALWERERPDTRDHTSPSTTVVAALLADDVLTVGWVGDSRAYWVTTTEAVALTRDHSWLAEEPFPARDDLRAVLLPAQPHAITRWLGADSHVETKPEVIQRRLVGEGTLLLCSDGLWNHLDHEQRFFKEVQRCAADGPSALSLSQRLVAFASGQGGHDNATVAVLRFVAAAPISEGAGAGQQHATEQRQGDVRRERTEGDDDDSVQG